MEGEKFSANVESAENGCISETGKITSASRMESLEKGVTTEDEAGLAFFHSRKA